MIDWISRWEWTPEAVIALAAFILSVLSWIHVMVASSRRIWAFVKGYTVWQHYDNNTSTVLMYADLSNASQLPISVGGIAVRFGNQWSYAERQPKRPLMMCTPLGYTPADFQQIYVSHLPLNLGPCHTAEVFFAVSGNTRFMPPEKRRARMRCRTSRRYTRCTLTFEPNGYSTPEVFLAIHNLVIEPTSELQC